MKKDIFKVKEVENLIETHLLTCAGYIKGSPLDYDKEFCIDKVKLFQFLTDT